MYDGNLPSFDPPVVAIDGLVAADLGVLEIYRLLFIDEELDVVFERRAVQRSVLSPKCNTIQRSEAQREVEDSADGKSLNLCEATESFGGRLEVVRTSSFAVRDNSRPASGRG